MGAGRARQRRSIYAFDTEDDSAGHPLLFCFATPTGGWYTKTQRAAQEWLARRIEEEVAHGRIMQIWATNLEYDLVNLFGQERIAEVELRFGRSALCGARWRKGEFRDTIRHLPVSVAELGRLVSLHKRGAHLFDGARVQRHAARDSQLLARCQRDAAITRRAADTLSQLYRRLGDRARMTLASTALSIWREQHWKKRTARTEEGVWNAALDAYHGGRTQAFAVGEFREVSVIDVASMFPWAMTAGELPVPWGLNRMVGPGADVKPLGLYRVAVESDVRRPMLPVRTRDGTLYPNGSWPGWYVGEELLAARARGVRIRTLGGFEFAERARPFDSYVRSMFRRKQRARGAGRLLYKLLLNSLYGKFGQQGVHVEAIPVQRLARMAAPPLEWREWCGLAIFTRESAPPPWSNNLWPAFITARARIRLQEEIERRERAGSRVLYCDTDSVIFCGGARYPKRARRPGEFEMRGRFRRVIIVGKKEYALEVSRGNWDVHAKGVPEKERMGYLRNGHARFERPTKLRESGRIGVQANVWRTVEKHRHVDLKSRAAADGTLPVPIVGPGDDSA